MKNTKLIDALIILGAGAMLILINELEWEHYYFLFSLIPLMGFYFLGKYVASKSSNKN